jgi:phosphoribosylformimino-5-aminoimidazole carboxamide ribotide isomerase
MPQEATVTTPEPRFAPGSFELIPAIDIRGGRCVRLFQGDYGQETVYGDPVEMARRWAALGAPRLHVVDLDGARERRPVNRDRVAAICKAVAVPVEVAGGIRTLEIARAWVEAGADRVQLGSAAVEDPKLVEDVVAALGERAIVSIDCRDAEVMTNGWLEGTGVAVLDLALAMQRAGVPRIMVTDIGRDGAFTGPNLALYEQLLAALEIPVIGSGGVSSIEDLQALARIGCEGAVVGKALYEGRIDLAAALQAVRA